jgi:hypothetical protein
MFNSLEDALLFIIQNPELLPREIAFELFKKEFSPSIIAKALLESENDEFFTKHALKKAGISVNQRAKALYHAAELDYSDIASLLLDDMGTSPSCLEMKIALESIGASIEEIAEAFRDYIGLDNEQLDLLMKGHDISYSAYDE